MKLPHRRQFLHLAAGAAALPAVSRIARAQAYPTRPVRIIVGFPPGGAPDIVARLIGQWLSERLGQPFIIENRPGAGSNIAHRGGRARACRTATRCSWSLRRTRSTRRSTTSSISISSATLRRSRASSACPIVMVVNPSVPAKTVPEFIAYAKANPGKINMASAGIGSLHPCRRRAVQDDGRRQHGPCALSRHSARADRSARRTGAGHVRHHAGVDRVHQGRQAARAGGDHRDALGGAAGHSDRGRFRAGLRGEHVVWHRRAQEHARRDRREAQQGNQCRPRRSQDQGAVCRPGRHGASPARPPTSASSSPTKPRNGARWSELPTSSRSRSRSADIP